MRRNHRRFAAAAACCCLLATAARSVHGAGQPVRIGSKTFTESLILAEIGVMSIERMGIPANHRRQLGGTRVLWNALLQGEIDLYPEYTGTIREEILAGESVKTDAQLREALARHGLAVTESLGFNNTYAISMKEEAAERLGIQAISDLRRFSDLAFGFTSEFMDRGDGWPALRDRYQLPQRNVRGIEHDLAYKGLESGSIQVTDAYSTDAEISYHGMRILRDDLGHFPAYHAVFLYRLDLARRVPAALEAVERLAGRISEADMIRMNKAAKIDRRPEKLVAAEFLSNTFDFEPRVEVESRWERMWRRTREHTELVLAAITAGLAVSLPLGILAARRSRLGQLILGAVGIVQTIPSLALLVFMIPLLGIGARPAICALFLYSLLPMVRNTAAGLMSVPGDLLESAEALGLSGWARLRLVELPLASRTILAGIKTSTIITVGYATLGALIGAGGYGQPILTGLRLDDIGLILEGAVPAALMALAVQAGFELIERILVPRGLRLRS